jgi:uncharacterized protein (DUF58 family)
MPLPFLPTRRAAFALLAASGAAALALALQAPVAGVAWAAAAFVLLATATAAADLRRSAQAWQAAPLRWTRALPQALALGVAREIEATLVNEGAHAWQLTAFDGVDPALHFEHLPQTLVLGPRAQLHLRYRVRPLRRGRVTWAPAQLRVRTPWGWFEWQRQVGDTQSLNVYPNFAAVARYAWLAGDRRLAEMGIKTYLQRGSGTDFKQLAEYKMGDSIRHIDWKATLRHQRPIVREFQDERDQSVLFLLDCGRRMRADEGEASPDGSHFDQALNALMLLAYVALKEGDEVGAMTFGAAPGQDRHFAPRKGGAALNALMARLCDIEPQAVHSDYVSAAQQVMRVQRKRSLVVLLTNFRDEDAAELGPALQLLRSRHLVILASLRERVVRELAEQALDAGLDQAERAIEVAGAHLFEQARSDALRRLAAREALLIDAEPARLPAELVNRYHAVKRAGLL